MLDLESTVLVFAPDAESSAVVLVKDLDRLHIQSYLAHGRLAQDKYMELEHVIVWVAIRNSVELAQKRAEEATVTTLKNQVSKIDSFTKK